MTDIDALLESEDPKQLADDWRHVDVRRRRLDVLVEHAPHRRQFLREERHELTVFVAQMHLDELSGADALEHFEQAQLGANCGALREGLTQNVSNLLLQILFNVIRLKH